MPNTPKWPIDEAWERILSAQDLDQKLRSLFAAENEEYLESRSFSMIHRVIIEQLYISLATVLNASRSDINKADSDGKTPSCWAALRGDCDPMRILLSYGATPSICCKFGRNALHYACRGGSVECVRDLLRLHALDVNQPDSNGNTAIHFASHLSPDSSMRICAELLEHGANVDWCDANR